MNIHFSPHYDGDVYLGPAPRFVGEAYVGNQGLLKQLQLRAGMHMEPLPDVEREAKYHNAMESLIAGSLFKNAFAVDPIGVAAKLLGWRDALIMAGWDGTCDNADAKKIYELAIFEKDFRAIGLADCWKAVSAIYGKANPLKDQVDEIVVECPWSEIPYLIQKTLMAINEQGTKLTLTIPEDAEAPALDTNRIKWVKFDDVNDAYEWFATIEGLTADTAVVNRDNEQLNHTLYLWDRPLQHASLKDSNPQVLQLFKLSMSIFSRPLNLQNLVSYLMLPLSPIPGKLRRALANVLLSQGGFGDNQSSHKDEKNWDEIIDKYDWEGATPQAKGKTRAKKMPFLEPIRKDYGKEIPKTDVMTYVGMLEDWAADQFADKDMPLERKVQLQTLRTYLNSLTTALNPMDETIGYDEIEKLVLQIYRPMNYALQQDEKESRMVVNDVRGLAFSPKTLLWLDCQDDDSEHDAYDFLSAAECDYLVAKGCTIPDFGKHLKLCRSERLRILNQCEHVILVSSGFNGTKRLGEHSMVAEARQAFKNAGLQLTPTDPKSLFGMMVTKSETEPVDVFRPARYVELGAIDYQGRVESNTSIDTLIQLPFNYVMQYVAKLSKPDEEQIDNIFIIKGKVAHHFFQHVIDDSGSDYQKMRNLAKDEFDVRLNAAIDATGLIMRLPENASELAAFSKQLQESFIALVDIMEKKQWRPVGCELPLPPKGEDLELQTIGPFGARIDFLLQDSKGRYVIIDFKWSFSKKYEDNLEKNVAIQLELYRQAVLATYSGQQVAGVGYYLMPKKQLFTTDFDEIENTHLIKRVDPKATFDLFEIIRNSFEFRMTELKKGHVEEGETMDFQHEIDSFRAKMDEKGLCPLGFEDITEGRGNKKRLVSITKKSESIFKPSKKKSFDDNDLEPSEIATSHPVLKGRLK